VAKQTHVLDEFCSSSGIRYWAFVSAQAGRSVNDAIEVIVNLTVQHGLPAASNDESCPSGSHHSLSMMLQHAEQCVALVDAFHSRVSNSLHQSFENQSTVLHRLMMDLDAVCATMQEKLNSSTERAWLAGFKSESASWKKYVS
jgi:hypothetical protein